MSKKSCFVIGPIGEEGSEHRKKADQLLRHVIEPASSAAGYEVPIRADRIAKPGIITNQIITRIIEDDLVIADLTGKNPNVFYELAVRHVVRKPVVALIKADEGIPFDVAQSRTILYDLGDPDSVENARQALEQQIRAAEQHPDEVDSPISTAMDLRWLRDSQDPVQETLAEILSTLLELRTHVQDLLQGGRQLALSHNSAILEAASRAADRIRFADAGPNERAARDVLQRIGEAILASGADGPAQPNRPDG